MSALGLAGDVVGGTAIVLALPVVILVLGTPIVLGVRALLWAFGAL